MDQTFQNQQQQSSYQSTPPIMLHKHMLSTQKFQEAMAGKYDVVSQVSASRGRFRLQQADQQYAFSPGPHAEAVAASTNQLAALRTARNNSKPQTLIQLLQSPGQPDSKCQEVLLNLNLSLLLGIIADRAVRFG